MTPTMTPVTDFSHRTCHNKRRFETKELCDASIAIAHAEHNLPFSLKSYFCQWCGGWHKTKCSKTKENSNG